MVRLRLAAPFEPSAMSAPRLLPRCSDRDLPVYSIIVPLYREARVLPRLIRALGALDYPVAKLEVLLVLEADDAQTRDALADIALPAHFEVILAPAGAPRTKPRALNVALPVARGEFSVVYDAEDVPSPGQLRDAVDLFARAGTSVACLQARLVVDNTDDSWISRFFTIEYASLFDVLNPALARFDWPLPLGGTSNHLRTDVVRRLHGWDAWNVTEDADLGIRLALHGYRVLDLPSSTLEEAPITLDAWLRQRTRWMKGFMQVCMTHSRQPLRTFRALGPSRFLGAVSLTFGTVAAALGYPVFTAFFILESINGRVFRADTAIEALRSSVGLTLFAAGYVAMVGPAAAGVWRRRWWRLLPWVPLMPFYYGLASVAAWRGLIELVRDPWRWNKTEHGLARTSRAGLLTDSAAVPRPRRRLGGRG